MAEITVNGKAYPLSAPFVAETVDSFPALIFLSYEDLTANRDALLRLSTARHAMRAPIPIGPLAPNGTLTVEEDDQLRALDRVINVHHGVAFLRGRDHAEFGFDGVDQVHGNAEHLPCGCILHSVHDHHRRGQPDIEVHPHMPRRSCERHASMADFKLHYAAAHADAATE